MSIVWKTNDIIADITTAYCHNRSKCIQPDQCEICKTDHNTDTLWFKNGIFWYLVPCFLVIFLKKNVIQNTNRCPNICCHFFTFYQSLFICGPSKLFIFLHCPTAIPNNKMHLCSLFIPKGRYEIPTEIQQQLNTVINSQKTK